MITNERIEKAVNYLADAREIAAARAEMVKRDNMLRHVKAVAMAHSNEKSAAAQERCAYASQSYLDAINTHAEAVERYELLRAQREAAIALIDAWRTQEASRRGADRAG